MLKQKTFILYFKIFTDDNGSKFKYINGIYVLQEGKSPCEGLYQNHNGDIFCDSSILINNEGFVVNDEGIVYATDNQDVTLKYIHPFSN